MKKKMFAPLLIAVFILPLLAVQGPAIANAETLSPEPPRVSGWQTITTSFVTVHIPPNGSQPMFFWNYNNDPNEIYIVRFDGLTEYFSFNTSYYVHQFAANSTNFDQIIENQLEHPTGMFSVSPLANLMKLREIVSDIVQLWGHPANLPFSACKWTETIANITANDANTIGIALSFNLTNAPKPFSFADNNVAITARLYNSTVNENVNYPNGTKAYSYNIGPNQMKMDLVVKDWKWNLGLVQPLLDSLSQNGITVPSVKSNLALGVTLDSINKTKLELAITDRLNDQLDSLSTLPRMIIENSPVILSHCINGLNEKPINVIKALKDDYDLDFANSSQTLAGFFNFVASAVVTNSTGSYLVPVKASYITFGNSMKVYISYPYFTGTITHDPSIGVNVSNAPAPPQYQVTIGSTGTVSAQLISPPIFSTDLVLAIAAFGTGLASFLLILKWRGRTIVLRQL